MPGCLAGSQGRRSGLGCGGQIEIERLELNVGDGLWADTDAAANEVLVRFELRLKSQP